MAFRMLSLRDRNLILGRRRVIVRGGDELVDDDVSFNDNALDDDDDDEDYKMVKMMTPTDWTTPPLTMTIRTSGLMLISRNSS